MPSLPRRCDFNQMSAHVPLSFVYESTVFALVARNQVRLL